MEIPSPLTQNSLHRIPSPLAPRFSTLCYWLSLAAFILAMLSKGSVTVLPVLLLGINWWLRPLTRKDLARIIPFFVVAAPLTAVNVWFQTHGTEIVTRDANFTERMLGAVGVIWFYLYKALLPIDLAFVYPQWHIKTDNLLWWLPLVATLVFTAVLWWYRKSWSRSFLFAWGFFCVALTPVMGFTDVGFMKYSLVADHYQHIAIIGVIALVSALWSVYYQSARDTVHLTTMVLAVTAIGVLGFLSWRQSGLYRDAMILYQDALEKNPNCWVAQNNLGNVLLNTGQPQKAIDHYRQSLQLKSDYTEARYNLGSVLLQTGHPQEAIEQLTQVLRLRPDFLDARNNLGVALIKTDRPQDAVEQFNQILRLKPDHISAWNNLKSAYARMNQPAEAIAAAQKAMKLARSHGQEVLAKIIEDWLNSYRADLSKLPDTSPSSKAYP